MNTLILYVCHYQSVGALYIFKEYADAHPLRVGTRLVQLENVRDDVPQRFIASKIFIKWQSSVQRLPCSSYWSVYPYHIPGREFIIFSLGI